MPLYVFRYYSENVKHPMSLFEEDIWSTLKSAVDFINNQSARDTSIFPIGIYDETTGSQIFDRMFIIQLAEKLEKYI